MRTWITLVAAVFVVSCGGTGGSESPRERISAHGEALRADTRAHGDRIAAMSAMPGIPGEEATHHDDVAEHAGGMHVGMSEMSGMCTEGDIEPMHDLVGEIEAECAAHEDAMEGSASMPDAHGEEQRHQDMMDEMLDEMDELGEQMDCGGMMGGGGMHD